MAHHYFWSGYWDGPLDGWIYVRGQFYHYDSLGDALALRHRIYGVYYVPKSVRAPYILRHRSFAHQVGRHTSRKPGCERRYFSEAQRPNWKVWYLANSKPLPPIERKLMVGITRLHDGIVHWLDKPENFSREWQYLDEDDEANPSQEGQVE
jgi:hypothetical protein